MGGAVSGALGAGMPMSSGAMGPGSYGSQNSVAMQTQQMARNPFGSAAGSSPFQPPMPARTAPQQAGGMSGSVMQTQMNQAPTPDDLYNDFVTRANGGPTQQPGPNPLPTAGSAGGKSNASGQGMNAFNSASMAQAKGPTPNALGTSPMQTALPTARGPLTGGHVGRQFISQGMGGPLIQGFGQR